MTTATAAKIQEATRGEKIEISKLYWRIRNEDPGFYIAGGLDGFKDLLVNLHKQGLVRLARADYPQAWDMDALADSQIQWGYDDLASWHLVDGR